VAAAPPPSEDIAPLTAAPPEDTGPGNRQARSTATVAERTPPPASAETPPASTTTDTRLAFAAPGPVSPSLPGGGNFDSCQIRELFENFVSIYLNQGTRTVLMVSFPMPEPLRSADQVLQVLSSGNFEPATYFPYVPETPDAVRDALRAGRMQCQLTPMG